MIGLHFWLRTKPAYPQWRGALAIAGLLLPTLALSGYVAAGNQVLRAAGAQVPAGVTDAMIAADATASRRSAGRCISRWCCCRSRRAAVRRMVERRNRPPLLAHAGGRTVAMLPGATVLETLREHGIPHAAVCGGRARCTTCRVLVTRGLDALPAPEASRRRRWRASPRRRACGSPARSGRPPTSR